MIEDLKKEEKWQTAGEAQFKLFRGITMPHDFNKNFFMKYSFQGNNNYIQQSFTTMFLI